MVGDVPGLWQAAVGEGGLGGFERTYGHGRLAFGGAIYDTEEVGLRLGGILPRERHRGAFAVVFGFQLDACLGRWVGRERDHAATTGGVA